jgi:hypothetical protein
MSYAIIRNEKYKRENLKGIYRHNERKNKNYSNKNINKEKSHLNYSLKDCKHSYEKEFELIREKYNLKGQIKTVSNIACEYLITSDNEFFTNIGETETKRYFEIAYKFVTQYKNLGEEYILSAKVHLDEETPHMHLVFIPVVHTTDKKGNSIDKIACSEFWKAKDSYKQLQDAFYEYMIKNQFQLERGNAENRIHLSVEDYKKVTGFNKTETILKDIKLELPDIPNINEFNKLSLNRDKKIEKEIIKPKDELIEKLHQDNIRLYKELDKQVEIISKAEEVEKENVKLKKENKKIEREYKSKINKLNDENIILTRLLNILEKTVEKLIKWVCKKFAVSSEESFIRNFENENNTYIDVVQQYKYENDNQDELKNECDEEWEN